MLSLLLLLLLVNLFINIIHSNLCILFMYMYVSILEDQGATLRYLYANKKNKKNCIKRRMTHRARAFWLAASAASAPG